MLNTLAQAASPANGLPSAAESDCSTVALRDAENADGDYLFCGASGTDMAPIFRTALTQASKGIKLVRLGPDPPTPGNAGGRVGDDEGMHLVLTLVGILATVIAVAGICSRLDLPSPLVLIAVGVVGSYLPFVPDVALEPEVVLFGLLPPLLYAAAIQTSLVDFNANRRPILLLSVGLVAFTTAGVAVLVHALLPDLGWAASFAIGAVVAPPDAVAATSDRPPHRAAAADRHHPRGRVAAQRRDRAGRPAHRDRGHRGLAGPGARLPDRRRRRRAGRPGVLRRSSGSSAST